MPRPFGTWNPQTLEQHWSLLAYGLTTCLSTALALYGWGVLGVWLLP